VGDAAARGVPAQNKISGQIRRWRLHRWIGLTLAEIARQVNPVVRGWMQYYGAFYRSALYPLLTRINAYLMRWVRKKYRRFQGRRAFQRAWQRVTTQYPRFFAHWEWTTGIPTFW
jgi:RNA-directed DNA polymerase